LLERDAARARFDELAEARASARGRADALRAVLGAHPSWLRLKSLRDELASSPENPPAAAAMAG
jgi:hypothetical protein